MNYQTQWRRLHKEVYAMAKSSSDDEMNTDNENHGVHQIHENEYNEIAGDEALEFIWDDNLDNNFISSSDSDDSEDFNVNDTEDKSHLKEDLATWATKYKCTRTAMNELLDILRKQGLSLPKDCRTLLTTPRSIDTSKKCGGDYIYLGIQPGLLKIISDHPHHFQNESEMQLQFNIDGVPLFKSSSVQLWPILCGVKFFEPFVVAVFCGDSKPNSVEEFLSDFLAETQDLQQNGLNYTDDALQLKVTVAGFICDAPARALVKCIKPHNAYHSCERCTIRGVWEQNRVVFAITDELPALRTEEIFNAFGYQEHQTKKSPLIDAGLSCLKGFPLDYMHLVCLGVVKRMLMFLKSGPRECKLSHQQLLILCDRLVALNGKIPREFARQPRSIFFIDKWKATELRQFLLYTGPLVLKSLVSDKLYKHFLTLTVAMSILLESGDIFRNDYLQYAKDLLVYFVKHSSLVYGEAFVSYNVHALIHLADDVQNHGQSLNDLSAFQFENHLHKLKKSVKKAQNPISQVVKRIVELDKSKNRYRPKQMHMHISTKKKDSYFLLKNDKIAIIKEKRDDKTYLCDTINIQNLESFFDSPCDSKLLKIAVLNPRPQQFTQRVIKHQDISKKIVCLPYDDRKLILVPMLHGMERN